MATEITLFKDAVKIINDVESKFISLVQAEKPDNVFKQEMLYASQAMMNNDFLCRTALNNSLSLRNAFTQLAASGLTLNPSRQLAYLVPRDGQVILDVSWRGMVKVAVTEGAIKDCIVELVYSNDKFEYHGKRQSPTHTFNPFAKKEDRGDFLGCYVEAALPDGRVHVEAVTVEEILAAREASDLWKRKKKGPWVDHEDAMRKKSSIKIARKYWPQVGAMLDSVIQYLNQDAGEGYSTKDVPADVIGRYLNGQEGAVEPLPTSNTTAGDVPTPETAETVQEVSEAAQQPAAEASEPNQAEVSPAPEAAQAAEAQEGDVQIAPPQDVPAKAIAKVAEVIRRAKEQGCWNAAKEHIEAWGNEAARQYGLRALQAAHYEIKSRGE